MTAATRTRAKQANWWRSSRSGPEAHLRARSARRDHRPRHQAQARRCHARGARGGADPRRSRRRRRPRAIADAVGQGPLRQGHHAGRRQGDPRRRGREDAVAGRQAAGDRAAAKPFVILVVGVNGSGKTTTIGKLAAKFSREGRKVMLAAGDTFRAAAIEQLKIWGERTSARSSRARRARMRPASPSTRWPRRARPRAPTCC